MSKTDPALAKAPLTPQSTWRAMSQVVENNIDPVGMATPLMHAQMAWLLHPQELSEEMGKFSTDLLAMQMHAWRRALGMPSEDPITPTRMTRVSSIRSGRMLPPGTSPRSGICCLPTRCRHALRHAGPVQQGAAPCRFLVAEMAQCRGTDNFLLTNPVAMRKAVESNGQSLLHGMQNFC